MAKSYINNGEFFKAILKWREDGCPKPIPNYIAECFMNIVKEYGTKRNFSGYSYIQDMKSEALEHCVRYADRFDPEKSRNPFSYFTQITHNAFIQFLNKEKKISKLKFHLTEEKLPNAHKYNYNFIVPTK